MTEEQFFSMLTRVMYKTRKHKRYGEDSIAFEWHWSSQLFQMFNQLKEKSFRIDQNYAFLTSFPKWREIFATFFQGRIADHFLCDSLRPYIEADLHPRTFNNREGKGSQAAINQVIEDITEVTGAGRYPARIIKWDLKGFFPNALCDYMCKCFEKLIDRHAHEIAECYGTPEAVPFFKWLAMICIHCYPSQHCERRSPDALWTFHIEPEKSLFNKPEAVGVPIGRLSSQTGMGLYINDEIKWFNDFLGIRTTVFMDDGVMVVPEHLHQYALQHFPEFRKRLAAKGVLLNDKKFYDQPYQNGLEFLGTHIKPWALHLNDVTYERAVQRIDEFNALPDKYYCIDQFLSAVNSYTGMLKNRTEYRRICELRDRVSSEWLEWLEWNERRQCFRCKPEHSFRARLNRHYHLKLKEV